MSDDRPVTVCAECLMASCWHGDFMCDKSREANIKRLPASKLDALGLEHPSYYTAERIARIEGTLP